MLSVMFIAISESSILALPAGEERRCTSSSVLKHHVFREIKEKRESVVA